MGGISTFILGSTVSALTLLVGVGLGYWLGRRRRNGPAPSGNDSHIQEHLAAMIHFTHHFSGDLSKHIELLENLEHRLSDHQMPPSGESTSSAAVALIAQVTAANHQLKQRLEAAEATLKSQARQLEQSASEARTDSLTGLLNRRAFEEERDKHWALWLRKQTPFCLLILDIDHFKSVNDRYGHAAGDLVLKQVANRLRRVMRQSDYLARIGGEEMAIILPEEDWNSILYIGRKVLKVIRETPVVYEGLEIPISASCGMMSCADAASSEKLMKGADDALYAAKEAGRDRAYVHNGEAAIPPERFQPRSLLNAPRPPVSEAADAPPSDTPSTGSSPLERSSEQLRQRLEQVSHRR